MPVDRDDGSEELVPMRDFRTAKAAVTRGIDLVRRPAADPQRQAALAALRHSVATEAVLAGRDLEALWASAMDKLDRQRRDQKFRDTIFDCTRWGFAVLLVLAVAMGLAHVAPPLAAMVTALVALTGFAAVFGFGLDPGGLIRPIGRTGLSDAEYCVARWVEEKLPVPDDRDALDFEGASTARAAGR
jgi:hypothetical protein